MGDVIARRGLWAPTFDGLWPQASPKLPPLRRWQLVIARSALPATVKVVAFAVSTFMNLDGEARPALYSIAEMASCDVATVCRALDVLEKGGWIVRHRSRGGPKRTTRYSVPQNSRTPATVTPDETLAEDAETLARVRTNSRTGATGSSPRSTPLEVETSAPNEPLRGSAPEPDDGWATIGQILAERWIAEGRDEREAHADAFLALARRWVETPTEDRDTLVPVGLLRRGAT